MKVVAAVLSGVPRTDIPERLGLTRKTVARDIGAVRKAIGGDTGTNRDALEETLGALRLAGRLETVDSAKIAVLRTMATQLDTDTTNSQMFSVYWNALEELADDDSDDGTVADVIKNLFSEARDETTT